MVGKSNTKRRYKKSENNPFNDSDSNYDLIFTMIIYIWFLLYCILIYVILTLIFYCIAFIVFFCYIYLCTTSIIILNYSLTIISISMTEVKTPNTNGLLTPGNNKQQEESINKNK